MVWKFLCVPQVKRCVREMTLALLWIAMLSSCWDTLGIESIAAWIKQEGGDAPPFLLLSFLLVGGSILYRFINGIAAACEFAIYASDVFDSDTATFTVFQTDALWELVIKVIKATTGIMALAGLRQDYRLSLFLCFVCGIIVSIIRNASSDKIAVQLPTPVKNK